jgi:DNA-binding LacI/PurR family transcriptional regulator
MLGYRDIAALMEKRIRHGDYHFKPLPTERALCREMEVSQKTARRALLALEERGLIQRKPHSRPQLRNGGERTLALLAPLHARAAAPSSLLTSSSALWESRANVAAAASGFTLHPTFYRHWDDPQIAEALQTCAGVLLLPLREPIPERVRAIVCEAETPFALLGRDWSAFGVPSLIPCPPAWVGTVLEHLRTRGSRRVALLSAYSRSPLVQQMIEHYELWQAMHGETGLVIMADTPPEQPFLERARAAATRLLAAKPRPDSALCISELGAIGLSRGLRDHGMPPGREIAVAALNYEALDIAPYAVPSITYVKGDPAPCLQHIVQWMARGGKDWVGPLLVSPWQCTIVDADSTAAER